MGELRVEHVPCFLQSEIQGEKIPETPEGFPFTAAFLDGLLQSCPVVVEIIREDEDPPRSSAHGKYQDAAVGLYRINSNHGRSYELFIGGEENAGAPLALWADEHDNLYGSLSLKGNNFSRPHIQRSLTAPSGYIPHGFQETDSFLRVVRASRMMSEAGISTEKIIRVVEPKLLRAPMLDPETDTFVEDEYEYVPAAECKRRLLMQHWNRHADHPNALEDFQDVSKAINEMSFFITLRAMSVGNRVLDLCGPGKEFLPQVEHIFAILEPAVEHEEGKGPLSVSNKEHLDWFFSFYLPSSIGINLAKLHSLGLMHTFPTAGNINALGDLVDLDSVKGAPLGLGDAELTEEEKLADLKFLLHDTDHRMDMERLGRNFVRVMGDDYRLEPGSDDYTDAEKKSLEKMNKVDHFYNGFKARLISAYIHERFSMDDEYDMSADDIARFLDFIDWETEHGEGFGYDGFLKLVLKHHLKRTDYETLTTDEELTRLTEQFKQWGNSTAIENTRAAVMSHLMIYGTEHADSAAEIELSVFYKTMDDLGKLERMYRHNTAAEFMESPDFIARIKDWLEQNTQPTSSVPHTILAKAVANGIRETISRQMFARAGEDPDHPGHTVAFFTEQVAPDLAIADEVNADVHGVLVDNVLCTMWAKVPAETLEAAIKPREEISLVRHESILSEAEIKIHSTPDLRLQQIFHDGNLIESLHIEELGGFGDGAILSFSPNPEATYVAWSMLDKAVSTLHYYVYRRD